MLNSAWYLKCYNPLHLKWSTCLLWNSNFTLNIEKKGFAALFSVNRNFQACCFLKLLQSVISQLEFCLWQTKRKLLLWHKWLRLGQRISTHWEIIECCFNHLNGEISNSIVFIILTSLKESLLGFLVRSRKINSVHWTTTVLYNCYTQSLRHRLRS